MANSSVYAQQQVNPIRENTESLNGLIAGQKGATFGAKAMAIGWTALQAVMNVVVIMAVIKGIQLLVKAIDNYIHRVDIAKDKLKEFNEEIDSKRNTYKEHAQLVDKAAESYDKLASKVNTDTNYNLGLNEDEYADFINLNNELAEAFPTLVKGYDESGNAILDFGSDCSSTTEKLKELLEAEKQAANIEIAGKLPEYFDNKKTVVDDYDKQIKSQESVIKNLQKTQELINQINSGKLNIFDGTTYSNSANNELYNLMVSSANDFISTLTQAEKLNLGGLDYNINDLIKSDGHTFWIDAVSLTPELQNRLQSIIQENATKLAGDTNDALLDAQNALKDAELGKELAWSDFTQNLVSGMQSKASYLGLSDAGKDIADTLVGSINSNMASEIDKYEDPYDWVRENILSIINGLNVDTTKTLNKAIEDYAEIDMSTLSITGQEEARQNLIDTINNLLPEDKAAELILHLGLEVDTPAKQAYDSLMNDIDSVYGDRNNNGLSYTAESAVFLQQQFDKLGINTEKEIVSFQKLFNETGNLTDAFNEYANAIDNADDAAEDLTSPSFETVVSGVQNLTKGFDQLDTIYTDFIDGEDFDYSNFLNNDDFKNTFGSLTNVTDEYKNAYNEFIEELSNSNGKLTSDVQSAFNNLATAYIENETALDSVTEATRDATIAQLEQMGVANAKQVVDERIIANTNAQALQEQYLAQTGTDLLNVTWEEISAFLNEANAGEVAAQVLARLKLQQMDITNNPINCAESIYQLYALANAAGLAGQAMDNISSMNSIQQRLDTMKKNGYEGTAAYLALQNQLSNMTDKVNASAGSWTDFKDAVYEFEPVEYAGGINSLAAAQKNLGSATDEANDALKKQIEALEKQKEALEKEKSDMEELHDAIMWFYDEQIEKIDDKIEVIENENEAYEEQKEEIDEQIKSIEKQIKVYDKQIKAIDKKIEALNKENDALGDQQDNLDDILSAIENNYDTEIKLIQDKIDALQDANDEEERALALEKAKAALQEARSRKVLQVYQKGVGFTYQVDQKAIKEAEEELENLQDDAVVEELQKQIELLEEARDRWKEIPDVYNKAMQEIAASKYFGEDWKNLTLFPTDELLEKFEKEYSDIQSSIDANEDTIDLYEKEKERLEEIIEKYDELIEKHEEEKECIDELIAKNDDAIEKHEEEKERINELKELWEDAKNAYIEAEYERQLATFFGSDYEYQLLNNSQTWREKYAEKYSEICEKIKELEEKIKSLSEQTGDAIAETGNKAQTAAGQVRDYKDSLIELDGTTAETTITTKNVTENIVITHDAPSAPSNTGRPGTTNLPSRYAKGGIITKDDEGDFDYIADVLGEDHMIAVKEGEAVIPKSSVDANPGLIRKLISSNGEIKSKGTGNTDIANRISSGDGLMEFGMDGLNNLGLSKDQYSSLMHNRVMSMITGGFNFGKSNIVSKLQNAIKPFNIPFDKIDNSMTVTIGEIHNHGVQDVDGFAKALKQKLPIVMQRELGKQF